MLKYIKLKFKNLVSDQKFSEILKGSAWALGAQVTSTVFALITSIIVARFYGAEIMGIMAMISSLLGISAIFTVLGTNTSILRLIPEYLAKFSATSAFKVYRRIQALVVGVSMFTGCLLFFSSSFIADKVFSKPHLSYIFALSAFFLVFLSAMNLNTQALRALRLTRTYAFTQMLPALSMLLILLAMTLFSFSPFNPVYALFSSYFLTAVCGALIMDRAFKKKMNSSDIVQDMPMKHILSVSLPMLMTATMTFVIGHTGVIMLGMFRSEAEVGYYNVAVKLATLTTFILSAINTIAAPKFSELYHRGQIDDLFYIAKKSAKLIFWTTIPILIALIILGQPILGLLFGIEFTEAYGAMATLVIGQFINSISGSTGYFMNMTGNQNTFRNIIFITSILNVILNLILIPHIGIYGAAIAGATTTICWNVSILLYVHKKYGKTTGYFPLT